MRIVLTGGGTGGHIFPLIAVARKLKEKLGGEVEMLYIGSGAPIERSAMLKEGIRAKFIVSGKRRRYFSIQNFVDFFKVPIGFLQSLWILLVYMPDVVFSKGSSVSFPVVLAAWLYRIPVLIHESDAVPGSTNQLLEKFSTDIVLGYAHAQVYFEVSKTAVWGNPVRPELIGDKVAALPRFNFSPSKPVLFVIGGSQGARTLNRAVISILPELLVHAQVIHQTGELDYDESVKRAGEQGIKAGREGYVPVKFLDEAMLRDAYAAADLVLSRAGANSIAEIAANGKPAILVPLEHSANNHQRMNAYEIAKIGGAIVLEESNLSKHMLLDGILKVLNDQELHDAMGVRIKSFYHPQAAENIADALIKLGLD
ncbi:undecaprenyldiphospho-muramoylpentapeptide beta-N-acetylglucosaminyltransferase [Patescibacteria group bacterium]|nr:MAG: undecaprenyldiphospho-muramoylpentapeptide beta-N-acetylglucosaminyltransferase [Patescibacteria group bacterium]